MNQDGEFIGRVLDLLYADDPGAAGVSRRGFYDVPRYRFEIALREWIEKGVNVLPELDALVTLTWEHSYGNSPERFSWSPDQEEIFVKALDGKTFWNIREIHTDEAIERMSAHLDILLYEREQRKTYVFRRKAACVFTTRPEIRQAVFDRDGEFCKQCKATKHLALDHIVPVKHGGEDHISNLQVLCRSCNSRKGPKRG